MIIRRSDISLVTGPINYWVVSYVLNIKSKHYEKLLDIIVSACNDNTKFSGESPDGVKNIPVLYYKTATYKNPLTIEGTAVRSIESSTLISWKDPTKITSHIVSLTVQWQEGETYIFGIDEKINQYLKQHCFFTTKLKLPRY